MFKKFLDLYISRKGYKDGFRGLSISFLSVIYILMVNLKYKLMQEYNSENPREKILEKYQVIADDVISEYKK